MPALAPQLEDDQRQEQRQCIRGVRCRCHIVSLSRNPLSRNQSFSRLPGFLHPDHALRVDITAKPTTHSGGHQVSPALPLDQNGQCEEQSDNEVDNMNTRHRMNYLVLFQLNDHFKSSSVGTGLVLAMAGSPVLGWYPGYRMITTNVFPAPR